MTAEKPPDGADKPVRWHVPAGKNRLTSLTDLDQRSRAYNMAVAAREAITGDLGGSDELSEIEKILVEQAALSSVVVKDAYTRWLGGEPIPLPELSVMQNAFLRIANTLGLRRRHQPCQGNEPGRGHQSPRRRIGSTGSTRRSETYVSAYTAYNAAHAMAA